MRLGLWRRLLRALQGRVVELEQRIFVVQDLEVRMGALETHFMLVQCSISGLTALQQIIQASKTGQGAALRQCLRILLKKRVGACPEALSARRRWRSPVLTMEYAGTRGAVEQLLALSSVDAICTSGVGGRVSDRLVRFEYAGGLLTVLGCSVSEPADLKCKTFARLNGSVSTRLFCDSFSGTMDVPNTHHFHEMIGKTITALGHLRDSLELAPDGFVQQLKRSIARGNGHDDALQAM